jgi:dUTP pyrophosphatase
MTKEEAEEYIKKLESLEKNINGEDEEEIDLDFLGELNSLLDKLNAEMVSPNAKNDIPNDDLNYGFNVNVKVKKLHENAIIPSYSKSGDAGMDLTAVEIVETEDYISYKTGLAFEIPQNYVGLLFPRSSNSKKDLLLTNSVGVIDSGYRGEIELRYKRIKSDFADLVKKYEVGDRVGQIIILPYPQIIITEVDKLGESERGEGGFGSTGK